jgi:hypothetical protein
MTRQLVGVTGSIARSRAVTRGSDSHLHGKFPHLQFERIAARNRHEIPPRIQAQIETDCNWFYPLCYRRH